jgi:pyrimidine-nucleoside phosphorylase
MKRSRSTPQAGTHAHPSVPDILAAKRDGRALPDRWIAWLIESYARDELPDYQMAAFAMAVLLRDMNVRETTALTLAMRDSGKRVQLREDPRPKLDKHSTGGVGDKVSLCLAPLLAACGARVPMISGRSLEHTGGTLDKLEAIAGFRVDLSLAEFERQVDRDGFALIGQTLDLAPADRKLYALRDVTATVESIPLITASILSKKLSEDLDALVMDIKVGRGAFMKNVREARRLARSIIRVGRAAGLPTRAVLTRMDSPLGRAVGNALEVKEAFEVLRGGGPTDLVECTFALGSELLRASKLARNDAQARAQMAQALASGHAAARMRRAIAAQGGDPRVLEEPERLPLAAARVEVRAHVSGYVHALDALQIGQLAQRLGAGRTRSGDPVDPAVGVLLHKKPGDRVARAETLAELHASTSEAAEAEAPALLASYRIARSPIRIPKLVIETIRS